LLLSEEKRWTSSVTNTEGAKSVQPRGGRRERGNGDILWKLGEI